MNKNSFWELSFIALFLFTMPGLGRPLSPWWTHFHMVDGDFRVVQCLHCNKLVRRGKAGCSTREASNSGMAKHMKTRHADQATQVVLYILKAYSLFNLIPTGSAGNWFCQGGKGSYGGLVATDHRSSLAPEKLDQILFLRENVIMANFDLGWD